MKTLGLLKRQKVALAPKSATVSGQFSIRANHAVAGNDDGNAVIAIGAPDGPDGIGLSDAPGDFCVAAHFAVRNTAKLVPYAFLELGPGRLNRQVKLFQITIKVCIQLLLDCLHQRMVARQEYTPHALTQTLELTVEHASFGEFQQAQAMVGYAHDDRAQWCR